MINIINMINVMNIIIISVYLYVVVEENVIVKANGLNLSLK